MSYFDNVSELVITHDTYVPDSRGKKQPTHTHKGAGYSYFGARSDCPHCFYCTYHGFYHANSDCRMECKKANA